MSEPNAPGPEERGPQADEKITHHAPDGIQEYDNPLPTWFMTIFWVSVVFSLGYFLHYHVFDGTSVASAYQDELAAAGASPGGTGEKLVAPPMEEAALAALLTDASVVAAGKAKFGAVCVACHTASGGGLVGPNLTDEYWIHGKGTLVDIYTNIYEGVLEKGMPPWGKQLTPDELKAVTAYVGTLRNTNVPGGKAAQGERVPPQ